MLMIYFAKSQAASAPRHQYVEILAYVQSAVIVVIALTQLFYLQDFLNIFTTLELGPSFQAYFLGAFLVWAEIFSLPFLLRMKLSKAFRVFCMLLLWFVSIFWIYLSIWVPYDGRDIGLLGGYVPVESGVVSVVFATLFGGLSINNIWGLWPLDSSKKTRKAKK